MPWPTPNKSWWKYGVFAYLLALPVMIWRSSKVGRTLSVLSLVAIGLWILRALAAWGLGLYANIFILQHLASIKQEVTVIEQTLTTLHTRLNGMDAEVAASLNHAIQAGQTEWQTRQAGALALLEQIEVATEDLQAEERKRVKSRIIEIREKVKLLGKSMDAKEIREQVEEIMPGLKLLREDEKTRFLRDLTEIGMGLDGVKSKTSRVFDDTQTYWSTNSATVTSGTVVMWNAPTTRSWDEN